MSALTDLFTSLANKVRSKLGTTGTYTPAQAVAAIDTVYTEGQRNPKFVDVSSTNLTFTTYGDRFILTEPNTTYIILLAAYTNVAQAGNLDALEWGTPHGTGPNSFIFKNSNNTGYMITMRTNSLASSSYSPYVLYSGGHGTSGSSTEKILKVVSD